MNTILHPTYFPNISHFKAIVNAENLVFEVEDNYQKQTYRNRTHIYGANGRLTLNVPVHHSHKNRTLYKDVKIANDIDWQLQHWKSLQSAYKTSPFFEFYEDEIAPLFHSSHKYLLEFNFKCLDLILDCMELELTFDVSKTYEKDIYNYSDFRPLVNARKEIEILHEPYTQVFSNKHGYINNLSILDLLFNEGANTFQCLHSQKNVL